MLAPLRPAAAEEAWETQPAGASGDVVSVLVHPATAKRYLMVVAGCDRGAGQPIRITLGPRFVGLKRITTGRDLAVDVSGAARQVEVHLAPGTAELFECNPVLLSLRERDNVTRSVTSTEGRAEETAPGVCPGTPRRALPNEF